MIPEFLTALFRPVWLCLSSVIILSTGLWWLTGKLSTDSLARLVVTVLANLYVIFLLEFGAYHARVAPAAVFAIYVCCMAFSFFAMVREPGQQRFPWHALAFWAALAVWLTGLQALIVCYGGASWFGDWYEHYERSLFYVDHWPSSVRFLKDTWPLPARGPIFNTAAALLMTGGSDFWCFQIYSSVLNSFAFMPLALLMRDAAGLEERSALTWSAIICAVAPFAVTQETFTWTKFFTHGILLAGIYLYRKGLMENRLSLLIVAFLVFAEAMMAHYLALLFVVFFALHFLFTVVRRKWNFRIIPAIAAASFLLMSPWFLYIFTVFGIKNSIASTSTFGTYIQGQADAKGEVPPWSLVFEGNMVTTFVPYTWRHQSSGLGVAPRMIQMDSRVAPEYRPKPEELNRVTEWFAGLLNNVDSIPGALGWAGSAGLLIAALVWYRKRNEAGAEAPGSPGPVFWILFFVLGIPLNILASRDFSFHGVGHLNLQTFYSLSAVFIFMVLKEQPRALKWSLVCLFLIESALICVAMISLQQRVLPIHMDDGGRFTVTGVVAAHYKYVNNYMYKLQEHAQFLFDLLQDLRVPFFFMAAAMAAALLLLARNLAASRKMLNPT